MVFGRMTKYSLKLIIGPFLVSLSLAAALAQRTLARVLIFDRAIFIHGLNFNYVNLKFRMKI